MTTLLHTYKYNEIRNNSTYLHIIYNEFSTNYSAFLQLFHILKNIFYLFKNNPTTIKNTVGAHFYLSKTS